MLKVLLDVVSTSDRIGRRLINKSLMLTIGLVGISFILFTSPALAETYTVQMGSDTSQLKFVPSTLEIKSGDTVKWVMNKMAPHNVVFEADKIPTANKELASSLSHKQLLFAAGDSYATDFTEDLEPGTYPYYCEPHRAVGMVGQIIVNP
ncbi:MAG: plastocyanin [Phormidesmis sp.]